MFVKAFLLNDDLLWDGDRTEVFEAPFSNRVMQTYKKDMVEPGKVFKEITICHRTYNLAYNKDGRYVTFWILHGEPILVETNGYEEPATKGIAGEIY